MCLSASQQVVTQNVRTARAMEGSSEADTDGKRHGGIINVPPWRTHLVSTDRKYLPHAEDKVPTDQGGQLNAEATDINPLAEDTNNYHELTYVP